MVDEGVVADGLQALRRAHGDELDAADAAAGGERRCRRRPIEIWSSATPSGIVIAGWTSAPVLVARRPVAVDVQVAVARERLAAVGELDLEEALALDRDVERVAGAAQRALLEAAAGRRRRAAPAPMRDALGGRAAGLRRRAGRGSRRARACSRSCSRWRGRWRRRRASAAGPPCRPRRFGVLRACSSWIGRMRDLSALAGDRADGRRGLAERLVDRLDDLLAGLVGAHRGDHVDHRLRSGRRPSPRARRRGPGRRPGRPAPGVPVTRLSPTLRGLLSSDDVERGAGRPCRRRRP